MLNANMQLINTNMHMIEPNMIMRNIGINMFAIIYKSG